MMTCEAKIQGVSIHVIGTLFREYAEFSTWMIGWRDVHNKLVSRDLPTMALDWLTAIQEANQKSDLLTNIYHTAESIQNKYS